MNKMYLESVATQDSIFELFQYIIDDIHTSDELAHIYEKYSDLLYIISPDKDDSKSLSTVYLVDPGDSQVDTLSIEVPQRVEKLEELSSYLGSTDILYLPELAYRISCAFLATVAGSGDIWRKAINDRELGGKITPLLYILDNNAPEIPRAIIPSEMNGLVFSYDTAWSLSLITAHHYSMKVFLRFISMLTEYDEAKNGVHSFTPYTPFNRYIEEDSSKISLFHKVVDWKFGKQKSNSFTKSEWKETVETILVEDIFEKDNALGPKFLCFILNDSYLRNKDLYDKGGIVALGPTYTPEVVSYSSVTVTSYSPLIDGIKVLGVDVWNMFDYTNIQSAVEYFTATYL